MPEPAESMALKEEPIEIIDEGAEVDHIPVNLNAEPQNETIESDQDLDPDDPEQRIDGDDEPLRKKFSLSNSNGTEDNQNRMKTHTKRVHVKRNFKCELCPLAFMRRDHLAIHMDKVHNGNHQCGFCGTMCKDRDGLKSHVRQKHSSPVAQPLGKESFQCELCPPGLYE